MKLEIPFFNQTTPQNCGPSVLRMVLAYFGEDVGIEILEAKTGREEGKPIFTIQIGTAAASLGYKTDFYSKHVSFHEENLELDYFKKYRDEDLDQSKKLVERLVEDAKAAGVNIQERTMSLEELLSFLTKDSIPIVLIDRNIIENKKEEGYKGHFVPLVGYNKQNVIIHKSGLKDTQEFMPVKREIFDKARKAKGTDEDIIVIYRK